MLLLTAQIIETSSGTVVSKPRLLFPENVSASIKTSYGGRDFELDVAPNGTSVTMRVSENGTPVQESTYTLDTNRRYSGEPITLNLRGADLRQLLKTFSELTGLEMQVDPQVHGTVTVHVQDMPWDEALDVVLRQNGLTYELQGKTIVIKPLP